MIWYQKKAYLDDFIDRISDLPRNVIGNILQYLPIQEQVRTSILSRKWRHKWASAPQLEFNGNFFEKCHESGVDSSSLVTEVLLLHNGPLHKCTFYLPPIYYKPVREECISKWILFLARKGVKVLELENIGEDTYQTPSHVFSCHDLTYLHLGSFILSTVPNFHGFKSLVDLNLYYMKFESCAFECLVSGCPSLLKLTIYHCSGLEDFYVSSALKSLHIEDDEVIKSICLKQTQNLASITLLANGLGDEIDREWVTDLFKDLSKLERLSLGTAYIEILSAGVGINLQVLLKDVKHLELKGVNFIEARELLFIIHLLESCSNLEKLVIKNNSEAVETQQISKEFDCINCKFNKLQTLDMTVKTSYKPALDFTRFVLANSPAFKKLTFKVGLDLNQSNAPILLSISQDLLQMERASPRSQVKFLHGARLFYF